MGAELSAGEQVPTVPRRARRAVRPRGRRVVYDVAGAGPAVVLLHGWGADAAGWWEHGYVGTLADHHRVLAVDLLGHGDSHRPHEPDAYRLEALAGDVGEVLDAERVGAAALWGYSLGGFVAWALAGAAPERVAGLVLGASAAGAGGAQRAAAGDEPGAEPAGGTDMAEAGTVGADEVGEVAAAVPAPVRQQADVLRRGDWEAFWDLLGDRPEWRHEWEAKNDPRALGAALEGLAGGGATTPEPPGELPVVHYVGEHDVWAPAVRTAAAAVGAPVHELAGADHLSLMTRTDEILALVEPVLHGRPG